MGLEIVTEQQGQVHVLLLGGRLDAEGAVDLELALQELEGAGARYFLFDLTALNYASSAGIKVLAHLADRLRGKGTTWLAGVPDSLREIFTQPELAQRLPVYADRRSALARHSQAQLDPRLVSAATELMGAPAADSAAAGGGASDLTQAAARLLGAKTAPERVETRNPTPLPPGREPAGLAAKLKRWLGPKS
ncbi:STAS domain-containing protein [Tahibacter amnicola]|uniref:STAS domain-containing protein n=1 Tax=Tahibacter amnicola TaxID=2976241 RepID=A0ABY6BHD7_9GAMM|nr:STAS domain-containing protein [Tahibacter amnicola]UXI68743.1 STAS domain-containing protein [Tahibacter amnicola]